MVHAYYAAMDRILGQWMRRAEEDGAVLLVQSDHGFKWGSDRPCGLASGDWSTAAFWHRPEGVLAIWGRGVRRGQPRGSARLVDVAPTVLALLDVPGEPRMTGRPVAAAFSAPLRFLRSGTATPEVRRVADAPMTEAESSEYAKKLLALGYLSPGETSALAPAGGDEPGLTEGAWNNLGAWELKTRKNLPAAEAAFRESLRLNPEYYSPMFNLAVLSRERGDTRSAEDWLFRSLSKVRSDPSIAVVSWARDYAKAGRPAAIGLAPRPGGGGVSGQRSDRARAGAIFPREQGLPRRGRGAHPLRKRDQVAADPERSRDVRDLSAEPRGRGAAPGALARRSIRISPRLSARSRSSGALHRSLRSYFLFSARNFSSIVASP